MIAALWDAESSGRMRKFIHSQCAMKNPGNSPEKINGQIDRAKFGNILTIQKNAWNSDPTGVSDLHARFFMNGIHFFAGQRTLKKSMKSYTWI
jgi:hypothetical protein